MRGAKGDGGVQANRFVIYIIERPFLSDGGEDEDAFEPRERLADAARGPRLKGKYARRGRSDAALAAQRCGSNRSGSGKSGHRGG